MEKNERRKYEGFNFVLLGYSQSVPIIMASMYQAKQPELKTEEEHPVHLINLGVIFGPAKHNESFPVPPDRSR